MTLIHQLPQFLYFGILIQLCIIAGLSEVYHSFGLAQHMECPFVELEIFIFRFYLVDVRDILHVLKRVLNLEFSLNLVWSVRLF